MLKGKDSYLWRRSSQVLFALLVVLIGIQFVGFVQSISESKGLLWSERPAGVEAFLPISALVALKAWLTTGVFDRIHPAGLVILLAAMSVSLFWKRAFCSWICPFGTLAEGLAWLGRKLFKRNFRLPRRLDYGLRFLKYIILGFFIFFIVILMDGAAAYAFLQTPYNMAADIKMLDFFRNMTWLGFWVIAALLFLSLLIENFWCRYLCPYGALLGLLGILSPWKIRRETGTCISCSRCSGACPSQIRVAELSRVWSPECTGCMNCVRACPVSNTLKFDLPKLSFLLSSKRLALCVLGLWFGMIGIAKLTGHWETNISADMYRMLMAVLDQLSH